MSSAQEDFRTSVLLYVQRALLGEVTSKMRSIEVVLESDTFHLKVWHEGTATEREKEEFDATVITDLAADFWVDVKPPRVPTFEFIRCDPPAKPHVEGILVFARSES